MVVRTPLLEAPPLVVFGRGLVYLVDTTDNTVYTVFMGTKRKKAAKKKATKKRGRGRPITGEERIDLKGSMIRFNPTQRDAIDEYYEELNEKREADGLKPMPFSTWMREVILHHIGRSDLGLAAKAEKAAKSAAAI